MREAWGAYIALVLVCIILGLGIGWSIWGRGSGIDASTYEQLQSYASDLEREIARSQGIVDESIATISELERTNTELGISLGRARERISILEESRNRERELRERIEDRHRELVESVESAGVLISDAISESIELTELLDIIIDIVDSLFERSR